MVRTEINTAATVQADIDRSVLILINRINRTGSDTFPTPDALLFADNDAASLPLTESSCRAGSNTGCRIAAEADECHKTGGESAGRMNADAGTGPGDLLVNQPGTSQRAGVATDAAVDFGGG